MSPEQILGTRPIDHRSDLWALAALLYRMVVGRPAFGTGTVDEVSVRVLTTEPQSAMSIVPELGARFDAWMAKGLAKSPAARFQTAPELAASLADLLATEGPGVDEGGAAESAEFVALDAARAPSKRKIGGRVVASFVGVVALAAVVFGARRAIRSSRADSVPVVVSNVVGAPKTASTEPLPASPAPPSSPAPSAPAPASRPSPSASASARTADGVRATAGRQRAGARAPKSSSKERESERLWDKKDEL
jgi:serine/threonine-protein kinase